MAIEVVGLGKPHVGHEETLKIWGHVIQLENEIIVLRDTPRDAEEGQLDRNCRNISRSWPATIAFSRKIPFPLLCYAMPEEENAQGHIVFGRIILNLRV